MGTVYLAEHPFMRRKAAVKVLRRSLTEDASVVSRFMNEARAANAVNHPNIIDIIDVGTLPDGIPYLMMEFLDGESLAARLGRLGRLTLAKALEFIVQTASALAAAHAAGIVHRDLKPDNLFVVRDGTIPGAERIKVLDFGIAKLRADVSGSVSETSNGVLMGTPYYMSPEQCRGLSSEIDLRTDIYALGVILYEMLCGAPPFQSKAAGDLLIKHISIAPQPPRQHNPDIPPAIEAAILKALAKAPSDRFASMDAFAAALLGPSSRLSPSRSAAAQTEGGTPLVAAVVTDVPTVAVPVRRREQITTFREGAAEVTPLPPGFPRRKRALPWLAAGVAIAIGGALSARLLMRGSRSDASTPVVAAIRAIAVTPPPETPLVVPAVVPVLPAAAIEPSPPPPPPVIPPPVSGAPPAVAVVQKSAPGEEHRRTLSVRARSKPAASVSVAGAPPTRPTERPDLETPAPPTTTPKPKTSELTPASPAIASPPAGRKAKRW
jgi:serine/threonine-protein kinase